MSKTDMSKSSFQSLKFSGTSLFFSAWKNKVIIHLRVMSHQKALEEMYAKREAPWNTYEDLLQRQPAYGIQKTLLESQSSYIRRLLIETLPNEFKGITTSKLDDPVHALLRLVEKQYGLSNAAGVVGLVKRLDEIANADFKSVTQLFQDLHSVREQVNLNAHEALHTQLISSKLMMVKVLAVLLKHLWGSAIEFSPEKFTLERVADKLSAIFGTKSKSEIYALVSGKSVNHVEAAPAKTKSKVLGKRKATVGPVRDVRYNYGAMKCHYCGGEHNKMNAVGPHRKADCPKWALDVAAGVYRRNMPSAKLRKPTHEPTPKMTGKGKGKAKKARREIPLEECQQPTDVAADACDATLATPSSPAPSISPPAGTRNPPTPGRDQVMLDAQESDEPMDFVFAQHNIGVNGGHVKDGADQDGPLRPDEQQIAEALNLETMRLEDKDKGYMFTFEEGSKHSNTHIGTVKLYFQGAQGISPFLFENIALVSHAKSNILREFWLKRE
ncbi:LOW QUALITY PROTEIN: hypothetical protein PHMEG_00027375, partial [Phytophthora megakarya]